METITCINEAIRRSKLTQAQNEVEIRDRQKTTNTRQQQGNTTPDSMKNTSDSEDSKPLQKSRNVQQ